MKFKFFYIPAQNSDVQGEELNKFCGSRSIATVEKHFVNDGQNSFWSICISYIEPSNLQHIKKSSKIDYREVLDEADFAVFEKLRAARGICLQKGKRYT